MLIYPLIVAYMISLLLHEPVMVKMDPPKLVPPGTNFLINKDPPELIFLQNMDSL